MEIKELLNKYNFNRCNRCNKKCQGHLDYDNLCSNLNYLEEYAEKNYEKNRQSFIDLKNIDASLKPSIFSFGCGLGLDFSAAEEIFGKDIKYYGIDECNWAIKDTKPFQESNLNIPNTIKLEDGLFMLTIMQKDVVVCFFNSLFTISNNTNLKRKLINALSNKSRFYIVCDYTINNNFHMPSEEQSFINNFIKKMNANFKFKCFEILEGKGIIVLGERR